jgi:HlyD family secretion protein
MNSFINGQIRQRRLESGKMIVMSRKTPQNEPFGDKVSKRPTKRSLYITIAVIGTLAVLTTAAAAGSMLLNGSPQTSVKKNVTPVATVTVKPAALQPVPDTLNLTGSISATDPLSVGSSSMGLVIKEVNVEEGDYVTKGQILCSLDSSVMRAQLAAAEARLKGAHASLIKAEQPNRREDIGSFEAAYQQSLADIQNRTALLEQAKASKSLADSTSARYTGLLKEGAVSQMEAQTRQTEAITAGSTVRAAQENLEVARFMSRQAANRLAMAKEGGRKEDVEISAATANENAATVQQMRAQIEQTIVRAPDDGLITKRYAHIGDVSTGTKPLFEMIRNGDIELRAKVSQDDIARLAVGQPAHVSDSTRETEGVVFQISPIVDETTRLGTVRIAIPSKSGFKPGMFVKGAIARGNRNALTVPNSAILSDEGIEYVFIYENGIAKKQQVSVGARIKEIAEVKSGLQPGEQVIVAGAGFLNDQDPVALGQ